MSSAMRGMAFIQMMYDARDDPDSSGGAHYYAIRVKSRTLDRLEHVKYPLLRVSRSSTLTP
ncbi:hypothetical protein K523DRAFT_322261 [Schizophyllum commune Tattone D]|nr:hypothetical protein K523DRAFT_322261 [Schizophyllum commune Tattone D]